MTPACGELPLGYATSLFFGRSPRMIEMAKEICSVCDFQPACLRMALDAEEGATIYERHGVFGGTIPSERLALERRGNATT